MSKNNYKIYRPKSIAACSLLLLLISGITSCKKYLDAKPDEKLVVPSTLADCRALLDYQLIMNGGYVSTEQLTDNLYVTFANWNAIPIDPRNTYIWDKDANIQETSWIGTYKRVLYANQVLKTLGDISPATEPATRNKLKGEALFYRGLSFFTLAQIWAPAYGANAATDPGIPLRLTPDISVKSTRGTVQGTYDQVLKDLNEAASLLPADAPTSIVNKIRPCKAAAHAALARVYLAMGDYTKATGSANSVLQLYNTLKDFNQVDSTAGFPFPRFNSEVIFDATAINTTTLVSVYAKIDSVLYKSYAANDLRRVCFFRENLAANAGTYQFIGNYNGINSVQPFAGLTTDELYLVRAEGYARAGNTADAMADLNTLLRTRWRTGTYTNMTAANADDALVKILTERRKELIFRSQRWTDLRRLNKDPRFDVTLQRVLNGVTYTLSPNDLRYTLLIPTVVIDKEPMPQNPR